jgi:hypothetical protein
MNPLNRPETELDRRLRRLHAQLDAAPDFMPRLAARIAREDSPADERSRALLRARLQSEQLRLEAALTRRLWAALATAGIVAAGAIATAWLLGPSLAASFGNAPKLVNPALAWAGACLLLGGAIGYVARRGLPRAIGDFAFG